MDPIPAAPRLLAMPQALLLAGLLAAAPADAAETEQQKQQKALAAQMQQLQERMRQMEQRNQELERRVQELSRAAPAVAAVAPGAAASAPAPTVVPQWGARLEQVEKDVKALARPVDTVEGSDDGGPQVETSLVAVAQQVNRGGSESGRRQGRLNYRGDVGVSVPAGYFGTDVRGTAVGQLRFGQGGGVAPRPTHTGAVNSTTFEAAAGSDQTYAVVAQAYYQIEWSLDGGRFNDQAGNRVELSVGKMDLFGFFDQNAVAGDEGAQFLNNVFVHNPLLDSGGDIGADSFGFAPGVRLGWFTEGEGYGWGASLGVFGAGEGSTFGSPGRPLVIGQLEFSPKQINGEARGSWRAYAWSNGRATDLAGAEQRHSGFGLSADQRFGRDWNLFARLGRRTSGDGTFDSAITFGFEHGGRAWGRGKDAVGMAYGLLKTGSAWRSATADGSLVGYAARGNEQIAELYYRLKLNDHLELSPDFQLIRRAGGDDAAPSVRLFGVRASLGF